ncbi:unnamed protein product [Phytophthora fragariaefolia]|uniref:Unnamed protein product n=1 Tax=Phytophthora fragariaefolia TaxID=1490495 RepID=A0A9W6Y745_9STRA|nr:unnamed protein product [Phytophthora fragariaefolia]
MQVLQGQAAVGRMILSTKSSAAQVRGLRSVQATLALLSRSDEIDTETDAGVKQIGADWDAAVKLWKQHAVRPVEDDKITFRGSCVRDGKHAYNSQVIAGEVGARVIEKFGWGVNLTEFDVEVVVVIFYGFMVAGIALADTRKIQFRNRLANESRSALADSDYVSTLRPSTAYLMLQLAQHKYGDVVLDSMCGIGTLPICSADFTNDGVYALGGELDALPSVLLVMSKKLFKGAIKDLPFRVVAEHMVSIGGLGGGIYVVEPAASDSSEHKSNATIGQMRSASSVSS